MPVIVKISELTELTSFPADGDQLVIQDISEPLDINKTKRIKISTIFASILANISTALSLASAAVTTLIYRRQGGSASNWNTSGTTTYIPTAANIKIQTGAYQMSLATPNFTAFALITFPVAFGNKPNVFVSGTSGNGSGVISCGVDVDTITNTGFYIRLSAYPSQNITTTLTWVAIGE